MSDPTQEHAAMDYIEPEFPTLDTVEATAREMPADAVIIDLHLEAARLAATKVYLKGVLQSALFERLSERSLQKIKEAIIKFPLIYDAEVEYTEKDNCFSVAYMTWDDHARQKTRPHRFMNVSPDPDLTASVVSEVTSQP